MLHMMAAGTGAVLANTVTPVAAACRSSQIPIGLQLYTVRNLMAEGVEKTLHLVSTAGYTQVELAGHYDKPAAELRRMLDREGLSAPSTHIPLDNLNESFDRVLADAIELGNRYVVLPNLREHQRTSIDDYKRLADKMNLWAEACQKSGLQFAYHNHDYEFRLLDREVPYDILLNRTDPSAVLLQLDLYWATKAGKDPVKMFAEFPGRFPLWHVKDMATDGSIADVGAGVIDFRRIFAATELAGLRYSFIEHDNTTNPQSTIHNGLAAAKSMAACG